MNQRGINISGSLISNSDTPEVLNPSIGAFDNSTLSISSQAWVLENGSIALSGTGPELLKDENTRRAYLGM